MSALRELARGRWPALLAALGVDERYLRRRNGPCPLCPGGKDRYRFSDHEHAGGWYCSQCGKGDGFELLQRLHGWSFAQAAAEVEQLLPGLPAAAPAPKRDPGVALNRVRAQALPAGEVLEVVRYLHQRGLTVPPGLEAHPRLAYYDDDRRLVGHYAAMLGRVRLASGTPVTYHRTYLAGGQKAPLAKPKKLMSPTRNAKGGAVWLYPAGPVLGIAEGIETAIAAHMLFEIPVWSVLHADGMAGFEVPSGVREIIVFGDADENFVGQAAAFAAAKRFTFQLGIAVRVELPHAGDWADVLLLKKAAS